MAWFRCPSCGCTEYYNDRTDTVPGRCPRTGEDVRMEWTDGPE